MKALVIDKFGTVQDLHLKEVTTPLPADGEVQIRVEYASINPVDWKICEGKIQTLLPHHFPLIPGWDVSGTIIRVGNGCSKLSVGDAVFAYCRKPTVQWGTFAEYVCFEEKHIAKKPSTLTFAEAATIPLVALTAWQALYEAIGLRAKQSILIHAGAGGVGSMALQFARLIGAKIYTTAREINHSYVQLLGANIPIDYKSEDFVTCMKRYEPDGVDAVLDCVGDAALENSYALVKKGGTIASIVNKVDKELCKKNEIEGSFVFVRPDGEQLSQIAKLFEENKIRPPYIQEIPIREFLKAFTISQTHHNRGKIALQVAGALN